MSGNTELACRTRGHTSRPGMRYFGVSLGHADEAEVERWVRALGVPEAVEVCTYPASSPYEHVAISIALTADTAMELPPVDGRFADAAMRACSAHAAGRSGRAIRFRGGRGFIGRVRVAAVLSRSDIARVSVPGGLAAADDDVVDAGAGVVPHWVDGVLTLAASRRPDGVLVPLPEFRARSLILAEQVLSAADA